jgi:hypothetical protein
MADKPVALGWWNRSLAHVVLTGYNTDIDHNGMTYHVQTEDKGRSNPFVESLVYAAGEILYSRRTAYEDMLPQDAELKAVANLMERQHRTIVEAIRRGRLSQLSGKPAETTSDADTSVKVDVNATQAVRPSQGAEPSLDQVILHYLEAQRTKAHLVLRADGDKELYYGRTAGLRIVAVDSQEGTPQVGVKIAVVFKSTAEPRRLLLAEGETGTDGAFSFEAQLPTYNQGTSAVVISASSDLGQSEIKHLVHSG